MHKRVIAALLALALAAMCACAAAQETAPLAAKTQEAKTAERLRAFGEKRSYYGVSASSKWLWQAKLGNRFLNMRLFTTQGEQLTFQEKLTAVEAGGEDIRLLLRANAQGSGLLLQLDQDAVDTLTKLNITEIVVADADLYVQAAYQTSDLAALRSLFHVGERELLCVSGETEPVTVVSVDGVRRQITK